MKIIDSNILNYAIGDVEEELRSFNPDVVGITSVTLPFMRRINLRKPPKKLEKTAR